jgi:ABC-type microcin C transport system duplicated ATPase subunit YejF
VGKQPLEERFLRLIEPNKGSVKFDGVNVLALKGKELKSMRRNMQIIFQDPYGSLDPRIP